VDFEKFMELKVELIQRSGQQFEYDLTALYLGSKNTFSRGLQLLLQITNHAIY
jgi:hypothetical protein